MDTDDGRMGFHVTLDPGEALVAKLIGQRFQVVRSWLYGWVTEEGDLLDRKP